MPPSLPLSEKGFAFTFISTLLLCLWTETATYCFTILLEICIVLQMYSLLNSHCLFLIFVCVVFGYLVIIAVYKCICTVICIWSFWDHTLGDCCK